MITVVAATSVDIPGHIQAIEKTLACLPHTIYARAQLHVFRPGWTRLNWERFVLYHLHDLIVTDFALIVQADGYAVHPECWSNEFLQYDYIGAPWKPDIAGMGTVIPRDRTVGNGGFSLRSKAWLKRCMYLPSLNEPEDVFCCRTHLDHFVDLKVAPPEVAARFSFEWPVPGLLSNSSKAFGVHGKWNL